MASSLSWWRSQHVLHKLGAVGILLSTLLFVVGFSVPAWTSQGGLWMWCSSSSCTSNMYSYSDEWMIAVMVTECIALLAYTLCSIVEILQSCFLFNIRSPYNRAVEILAGVAGVASLTGAAVFGVCWFIKDPASTVPGSRAPHGAGPRPGLDWAFGLVLTASVITLLSATAVSLSRRRRSRSTFPAKDGVGPRSGGRTPLEEEVPFQRCGDPDSSTSMMLVPASHFDRKRALNGQRSDPPPYALPPPYPYRPPCDFFLPIAHSSPLVVQASGATSDCASGGSPVTDSADQCLSVSVPSADRALTSPPCTYISPASAFCIPSTRPLMRPLFIKTADGASRIEITPSAPNSSGLPSPFNHF